MKGKTILPRNAGARRALTRRPIPSRPISRPAPARPTTQQHRVALTAIYSLRPLTDLGQAACPPPPGPAVPPPPQRPAPVAPTRREARSRHPSAPRGERSRMPLSAPPAFFTRPSSLPPFLPADPGRCERATPQPSPQQRPLPTRAGRKRRCRRPWARAAPCNAAPTSRAPGAGLAAALTDLGAARAARQSRRGAGRSGAGRGVARSGRGDAPANPEGVWGRRRSERWRHAVSLSPNWEGSGGGGGGEGRLSRGDCVLPAARSRARAGGARVRLRGSQAALAGTALSRRSCALPAAAASPSGLPEEAGVSLSRLKSRPPLGGALGCRSLAAGGQEQSLAPSSLSRGGAPVTGARRRRSRQAAWEEAS